MTPTTPDIATLKSQAKRLRSGLGESGHDITHGAALELVARQHGFRDWNTAHALAEKTAQPMQGRDVSSLTIGSAVSGRYLGHTFSGRLVALQALSGSGRYRATIQFDQPVDVVAFESFSSFRRRITAVVDAAGRTRERTSDGRPHLELSL
ncbi:glyoxalase superfamily protein [Jiella sp. M17.18]|uniref:glyoxalase superfamily protein n=1 Tax=Jiella sp. M17.18 TaxID=3234247 RepID=UPI0034DEA84D